VKRAKPPAHPLSGEYLTTRNWEEHPGQVGSVTGRSLGPVLLNGPQVFDCIGRQLQRDISRIESDSYIDQPHVFREWLRNAKTYTGDILDIDG